MMKAWWIPLAVAIGLPASGRGMAAPAAEPAYLESNVPATLSILYDADGALATVQLGSAGSVRLRLERKPAQVVVDGKELRAAGWRWERGGVALSLAVGEHQLELNFQRRDLKAGPPSVTLQAGKEEWALGVLQGADRTVASGAFVGPTGRYRVQVAGGTGPLQIAAGLATLAWKPGDAPPEVLLARGAGVGVTIPGRRPPRAVALRLEQVGAPVAQQAEATPSQQPPAGILVEAEAFAAQGGGEATISRGEHAGTHASGSLYNWGPPGHWLEWEVTVPKAGRYRPALAAAGLDPEAFIGLSVDGREPFPGAGLLAMPGTGGWARTDPDQWRLFDLKDAAGRPASVTLSEGKHRLRLTNLLGVHLNLDYLALVPQP